jgi:hypothetical protein
VVDVKSRKLDKCYQFMLVADKFIMSFKSLLVNFPRILQTCFLFLGNENTFCFRYLLLLLHCFIAIILYIFAPTMR